VNATKGYGLETTSRVLNIIGVALLITELFNLREKIDAGINAFRRWFKGVVDRGFAFFDFLNHVVTYYVSGLAIVIALGVAAWRFLSHQDAQGHSAAPNPNEDVAGLLYASGYAVLSLVLAVVALGYALWAVLWVLGKFPRGTLGAIGAICAVTSLVLDYV
jgi:hypothetical protein